mmetsp:Transcript_60704/g.141460  ORF Transcript_60704/g.141460 Transcript_60704/m.141460 type:complete len:242 (-) Transcript_60704:615-1340(-)
MASLAMHDDAVGFRIHADHALGRAGRGGGGRTRPYLGRVSNRVGLLLRQLFALPRPSRCHCLDPALWNHLCDVVLEHDRNLALWQHGENDATVRLDTPAMVPWPLEVCHNHIPHGQLWNLGRPVPHSLSDPSLGDALLDTVVKVEFCLEQRRSQHSGYVRVVALLAASSLEVRLHPVTCGPLPQASNPPKWYRLLDCVLELYSDSALHAIRHHNANVGAGAPLAVIANLKVDIGDTPYLHG